MSGRKRPSGVGSNSRRFATQTDELGREVRVPVTKDAGSFVYIRGHDGSWPSTPVVSLAYDAAWLVDGAVFELVEMRPGNGMGATQMVEVVELRIQTSIHPGKWGQVKRLALVVPIEHDDAIAGLTVVDLEARAKPRAGASRD